MTLMQSGPVQLPEQTNDALRYLGLLIEQLQLALEEIDRSFYSLSYAVPDRPRDFMIRIADGTEWNPGYGYGMYQYYNGAWHPIWAHQWG